MDMLSPVQDGSRIVPCGDVRCKAIHHAAHVTTLATRGNVMTQPGPWRATKLSMNLSISAKSSQVLASSQLSCRDQAESFKC